MKQQQTLFSRRHIGPSESETKEMLNHIGVPSLDALISETVPDSIRMSSELALSSAMTESEFLDHIRDLANQNDLFRSFLGQGYFGTITPSVILRNVFENPSWYTSYTPYQAEISQGRLEALLNFQTTVMDLTGMDVANASLLDEGTAAAEAMTLLFRSRSRDSVKNNCSTFFVSDRCLQQTIDILITRAKPLNIQIVMGSVSAGLPSACFGGLLQYPCEDGQVENYEAFIASAHDNDTRIAVATDLLALTLLKSPGEMGADVVIGSSQRFGVPLGYGGPHAGFFATKESLKRQAPGRIIGVSKDRLGGVAYRMALQTREQHIRRDKATSNICTAQALLAIMAGMYAVFHGPEGLKRIAGRVHGLAGQLADGLTDLGLAPVHQHFFDTIKLQFSSAEIVDRIKEVAISKKINLRYFSKNRVGISIDETTTLADISIILGIFVLALKKEDRVLKNTTNSFLPKGLERRTAFLQQSVFNRYHSETDMMRYLKSLERKDIALDHSMIPLGSCTMKLNPATSMMPLSWAEFASVHPFVPIDQVAGYQRIIEKLEKDLCVITGLDRCSLQPNSGAQGEYAGLLAIMSYYAEKDMSHRNVALIPSSAHGTNFASAALAGMKIVVIKCDDEGCIDVSDLDAKAKAHQEALAVLMVTYPSTHGVFEETILSITALVHQYGGQVYMDGANMNAQVGLTNPGRLGADVCHLNLHKTFAIPHGGGGPGMGPICVSTHLAPYLPGHQVTTGRKTENAVSAAPWGSALILLISYAYIRMLGIKGLKSSTEYAILNANYLKSRLSSSYNILYSGKNDRVAHEMILDFRSFKKSAGIDVTDVAKRLIDYGFHAPTMSWPVPDTLMVEPTESESKRELDRFCDALISIRKEIADVESGLLDANDNVLKNAPHIQLEAVSDTWTHAYTRERAVYPVASLKDSKYWSPVARVDNAYGDRNLFCSCIDARDLALDEAAEAEKTLVT
ncbi:MAG: glycine dehydrogenase [Candidatus Marinamargulisbacteria bacterium]|jgi:glycine dehydrogenase